MLQFLHLTESLCGPEFITSNMHMHTHLHKCLEDYDPIYGFWCFRYERMNGELSALHTSNRTIPIDVMKLINEQINIYGKILKITPSLLPTITATLEHLQSRAKISVGSLEVKDFLECRAPSHISHFDDKTVRLLALYKVYGFTFHAACDPKPDQNAIYVSDMMERFATIRLGDEVFGSQYSRSDLSSYVIVSCIDKIQRTGETVRSIYHWPAKVLYYFKHRVLLPKEMNSDQMSSIEHCLAFVDWFDVCNNLRVKLTMVEGHMLECFVQNSGPIHFKHELKSV
ncbi:8571_t:CDS:2 [Ambispora gerdemannii]|uniref:8571_t:CDS:1 n=1 Tax=Ambispora gerdemannii TaxID=144530 RepID=A0A9N9H0Z1_9GLOM|nr:8571_t:CDS:2 [Ambispora gerdemannii]